MASEVEVSRSFRGGEVVCSSMAAEPMDCESTEGTGFSQKASASPILFSPPRLCRGASPSAPGRAHFPSITEAPLSLSARKKSRSVISPALSSSRRISASRMLAALLE